MITHLINWLLHLDVHLLAFSQVHGAWVYVLLFSIIFIETGVVILPFLPGDSLLFVAGAIAARGAFPLSVVMPLLIVAAVLGDALNFWLGSRFGHRILAKGWRWPKAEHLRLTHEFFERHGGKTIFLARFVPIIRTLAPFVAGMGAMSYRRFAMWNVTGAITWVVVVAVAGYLFGNIAWVQRNFTAALLGIIVISLLPGVFVGLKNWWQGRKASAH
ncbi:MAG TPA: DedA family protein [Rhodanobacteraceae bacterium]